MVASFGDRSTLGGSAEAESASPARFFANEGEKGKEGEGGPTRPGEAALRIPAYDVLRRRRRAAQLVALPAPAAEPGKLRDPQHVAARAAVRDALRRGSLVRPTACQGCGALAPLQAHHVDYARPLIVAWFCRDCHERAGREIRRRARVIGYCRTSARSLSHHASSPDWPIRRSRSRSVGS